jgi:hypothetical protein
MSSQFNSLQTVVAQIVLFFAQNSFPPPPTRMTVDVKLTSGRQNNKKPTREKTEMTSLQNSTYKCTLYVCTPTTIHRCCLR